MATNKERREDRVEASVVCSCGNPMGTLVRKWRTTWVGKVSTSEKVYRHRECPA
jgi:hypothetical protein